QDEPRDYGQLERPDEGSKQDGDDRQHEAVGQPPEAVEHGTPLPDQPAEPLDRNLERRVVFHGASSMSYPTRGLSGGTPPCPRAWPPPPPPGPPRSGDPHRSPPPRPRNS